MQLQTATYPIPSYINEDKRELEIRARLKDSLEFYGANILKIRAKNGAILPLILNDTQRYINDKLEEQKRKTGRVRALVLKGRQQGCSTLVSGRFYHKTTHKKGYRTFISTHEAEATANLFDMVQRFYDHTPSDLQPFLGTSNQKALEFSLLDSGYRVGTAGKKGVGRSNTIQLFHGSEVAFWPNADEHAAGILQAVPKENDTEIILESTANGMGNFFYQMWTDAVQGKSEFIPIFTPWFWSREYRDENIPPGFSLTDKELAYMELHGLDLAQMNWRRKKIIELKSETLFKQEYPATADEAFQTTGSESYINSEAALRARRNKEGRSFGAIIAGYDPKRDGKDRHGFIYRQGLTAWGLEYLTHNRLGESVAFLKRKLDSNQPYIDVLFVDYGGSGWEIVERLHEDGYDEDRVRVVNFGEAALHPEAYPNRRTEMWGGMKDWIESLTEPASIPDHAGLHVEIVAPTFTYDSRGRPVLESKKDIKKRLGFSPDGADTLALTFAEKVIRKHVMDNRQRHGAETAYNPFKVLNEQTQKPEAYNPFGGLK